MIRLAAFLILTAALAVVAVWFADRPGTVEITWLGYHAATSVAVLAGVGVAIAATAVLTFSMLRLVAGAPAALARRLAERRAAHGRSAIARGLIAVGTGDVGAAQRFAALARRSAGGDPLALLLAAQAAQLAGDSEGADAAFQKMAQRPDTKLFGLRGLFIEAQRRNDPAARIFAEEAAKTSPSLAWAGEAALQFRCRDGDWPAAIEALERNRQGGLVARDRFRRLRAVLLAADALSSSDRDRTAARERALEAVKLCPGLVPAAALAGRLLAEAGEPRKAGRVLEAAWCENPHPDLAEAYANLVPGAAAQERLARMRVLARLAAGDPESALAVAQAALDANEFSEARAALAPLVARPTRRIATLMSRLEEAEHGDTGRAREWMARAVTAGYDKAWTADGIVVETWLPVSPVTGRLDAFEWRAPVAGLARPGPLIDERAMPTKLAPAASAVPVSPSAMGASALKPQRPEPTLIAAAGLPAQSAPMPAPPAPIAAPLGDAAPPVTQPADTAARAPLHLPDDPGLAPLPKLRRTAWRSWFPKR